MNASATSLQTAAQALSSLWRGVELPAAALHDIDLEGHEPVLASSFAVGTAAQASLAAAALAAVTIGAARGVPQRVAIDMRHAALECRGWFSVDGCVPEVWDKISGLYPCADGGWVRIHANFAHHRDGALRLLGLPPGAGYEKSDVAEALRGWQAFEFETAASEAGLVVAAARSFDAWDAQAQAQALREVPLVRIDRIGDAPPRPWPALGSDQAPLFGLRVLDLTRILAGPVAGRTLAAYGADVMLVNSPQLPNIASIADTSRGKLSVHLDLKCASSASGVSDLETLHHLLGQAHVFLQGYRPGALQALGLGPEELARRHPGMVCTSLSAYGGVGPWGMRRGFDSLVQTATGFNLAEAAAFGATTPRALPMQILDYAAGYLLALGTQAALLRQAAQGGSWHVQVSLAGVGRWLRTLGRVPVRPAPPPPAHDDLQATYPGGFGTVVALRHAARFSRTPATWPRPSMPPGSHRPEWP